MLHSIQWYTLRHIFNGEVRGPAKIFGAEADITDADDDMMLSVVPVIQAKNPGMQYSNELMKTATKIDFTG